MALAEYRQKRSFEKTPEPTGGKPSKDALIFVIQKHDASRLHYDFRIELGGVLKSWAVPKGPSVNPDDKRLAMMVEDHPFDYKDFEGIIPKGQYGGGTVIIWDKGRYRSVKNPDGNKKSVEKTLLAELKRGLIEIFLEGEKLQGQFALVKSNYQGENSWLLIKMKDKFARKVDILRKTRSVISAKTIEEMAKDPAASWQSNRGNASSANNSTTSKSGSVQKLAGAAGKEDHPKKAVKKISSKKASTNNTVRKKAAGKVAKKASAKKISKAASAKAVSGRTRGKKDAAAGRSILKETANNSATKTARSRNKNVEDKKQSAPEPAIDSLPEKTQQIENLTEFIRKNGKKAKFPASLKPMLATLTTDAFDEDGWLYEVKWDGYRALAHLNKGEVQLNSRNNKSFNEKFYPIREALESLQMNAVFDGEIIVTDANGVSNFGALQNWRSEADGEILFYVFDLLWYEGYSLMHLGLTERRQVLEAIFPDHPLLRISQEFGSRGLEFFAAAKKMNLEGIMAKKADSEYIPGARSKEWLKIKINTRQEVVIGGYTQNDGSSRSFSSLLVGVFDRNKFRYIGKVGTGFSAKLQKEMMRQFERLIRKTSPFDEVPDINKPSRFRPKPPVASATWLEPKLICEVSYTEITSDGVMRHPSFEGMREDKAPKEVRPEQPIPVEKLVETPDLDDSGLPERQQKTDREKLIETPDLHDSGLLKKQQKTDRKTLLNPKDEQQERKLNGHTLKFNNLSKLYWPKEKISKRQFLNYYYQAAPFILPYLIDRPQSLNRHPGGITGKGFYQKNMTGKAPDWIELFPYVSEGEQKNYMVCTNEAGLLYMASLGCIEMNPWSSRIQSPDNPDFCIIDLDPDKNSFDEVVETATVTHKLLAAAGVDAYIKTSGSTGMHIYIPLGAQYDYEVSKEFGRLIATMVHEELPKFTSIERATAKRRGKIYIDFLQNRPQATIAAAYSLRPKPGATVSMPLHWDEVKKGLKISDFHIKNAIGMMRERGDIFKPVLGKGIDIAAAIGKLENL